MLRLFLSTAVGVAIGLAVGLLLGWEVFPVQYVDSPMRDLARRWQDEYTVMVAAGYVVDGDVNAAVDRLRSLQVDNIPDYVQDTTERYISNSRDLDEIRKLVSLSEGLGRLTPLMENFRQFSRSQS